MREWAELLNPNRFRESGKDPDDKRTPFERDYDRIIYSSAFRRLQDKAQVFPLEQSDFVRTRLTHSLETATLARSLGADVARTLSEKKGYNAEYTTKEGKSSRYDNDFGNILASVALVHDIGNPPFGHFGEESIGKWFTNYFSERYNRHILTKSEQKDFTNFEGNAQTLRILTRLQTLSDDKGLNLTYATLASLVKYPRSSKEAKAKDGASYKKYGYFMSDKERFEEIRSKTTLQEYRHPLAFLLEAADDIAYSAGDVEDAVKKRVLTWEQVFSQLKAATTLTADHQKILDDVKEKYDKLKAAGFPEAELAGIQFLRIGFQGRMLRDCVNVFVDKVEDILEGKFDESLLSASDSTHLYGFLKDEIAVPQIYSHDQIIKQEIVGNKVIDSLLSIFVDAVRSTDLDDKRTLDGKVFSMISPSFVHTFSQSKKTMYNRLQLVTDYISGMTDSFALDMYQKLNGIKPL